MPGRQPGKVTVLGWIDDSHFKLRTYDDANRPVLQSVNIRTGKSVILDDLAIDMSSIEGAMDASSLDLTVEISPDKTNVVISKGDDLYLVRKGEKGMTRLTNDSVPEVNVRFSPEGSKIAYTRDKDLYVYDLIAGKEIRLTHDATDRIYNGYSSWVYMEEILGRSSHYAAFWWSPDGNRIAYLRTDETHVPVFTLNRLDKPDGIHGTLEVTPYPKPGDPNPRVKMGIADVNTAITTWVNTDYSVDQYLAWPFWTPDSRKLAVQVVNRDQNILSIILADPETGDFSTIYEESNKTWVEFHEDIEVLKNGSGFILRSNRSGWENLYLIGWNGRMNQLTGLGFRITSIDLVDEDQKIIYFTATGSESTDSHAFRVGFDGKDLLQMTKGEGTHSVSISPRGSYYIDTWNSISSPGSIIAYDRRGRQLREIYSFDNPQADDLPKTEFVRIRTSDGLFNMPATITYPIGFDPSRKYPVVFTIYGGPDSRNVYNKWDENVSWYSRNGIVTFKVDHRGSGHFGKTGLDYLYRNLGKWELLDYIDAVNWLRSKEWVDPSRMGITGSSYGGYMTCMALTKGAGFWTHGFAGSSVTDWRLYDDIYTERFMDTPEDNPVGYREGSVLTYVRKYKGKLYFTHGDADDNVHMQNSIYLISSLQDEGKVFEFMLYPGGRHSWGGAKAAHLRNEEYNFWLTNFFDE